MMHRALNANIWEILHIQTDHEVLHPLIDLLALQDCLHTLVDYLRELLLNPGAQWSEVDPSALRITALHGQGLVLAPKHAELAEAILYRYFVHRSLYSGLEAGPIRDERRLRLSQHMANLRQSPPSLATDCLKMGDPSTCAIDLVLNAIAVLPREGPCMTAADGSSCDQPTLTLSAGLGFCRRLPHINRPSLHVVHDDEDAFSKKKHGKRRWMEKSLPLYGRRRATGQDHQADTELWSSIDVVGAGALFLRAWWIDLEATKRALVAGSNLTAAEWPGWLDTATIRAFTASLPILDSLCKIAIEEKDNDMSTLQTTVELNLIVSSIGEASSKKSRGCRMLWVGLDLWEEQGRDEDNGQEHKGPYAGARFSKQVKFACIDAGAE
ncbi:hypothetical protein FRB97_008099 [Tulasnella sp. 331]|nr:hypothetical protein FRB97_008099 [Tulasnella sp. 331]